VRELVNLPNPILRQKSKLVKEIDLKIKQLALEMMDFLRLHHSDNPRPAAIAAVQLGELARVIAFNKNPDAPLESPDVQVLINPELVYQKGSHLVYETCLSIPGKTCKLKRAKLVKIKGLNLAGEVRSFRGRDLLAQVFQHELNHLDGILIDTLGREG